MQINPAYPLWAAATFSMSSDEDALTARRPLDVALRRGARNAAQARARRARHGRNGARGSLLLQRLRTRHESLHAPARRREFPARGLLRHLDRRVRAVHLLGPRPDAVLARRGARAAKASSAPCSASASSTFWRDNSTGCKDVCDEQHFEQRAELDARRLLRRRRAASTSCLLEDFDALLADPSRDHLIVLHQRGSHGPAYHSDVPTWAKEFLPECDLPNLRNCDRDARSITRTTTPSSIPTTS